MTSGEPVRTSVTYTWRSQLLKGPWSPLSLPKHPKLVCQRRIPIQPTEHRRRGEFRIQHIYGAKAQWYLGWRDFESIRTHRHVFSKRFDVMLLPPPNPSAQQTIRARVTRSGGDQFFLDTSTIHSQHNLTIEIDTSTGTVKEAGRLNETQ